MRPTKIGNEWITSTYKNFPISRLKNKTNKEKTWQEHQRGNEKKAKVSQEA